MSFFVVFSIFTISAYLLQTILGIQQIKHFNKVYQELKSKGRVAIGRRPGKIRAGTIVMFSLNPKDKIVGASLMQGVTVMSKFKSLDEYLGEDIHFIDRYHPLVQKENKLTQYAMEDARKVFLQIDMGNYKEESVKSPFQKLRASFPMLLNRKKEI